jgi:DNA modification methylase
MPPNNIRRINRNGTPPNEYRLPKRREMIELNTIYNEDCLETMKRMPDNFVDLTITSPPYDNLRTYNGYSFDFESIAQELYRVTKDGGLVVWVVGDATVNGSETGTSFKQALYFKDIGFNLHDTMIYHKQNYPPLTHNRYEQCFEYMFVFSKGKPETFNPIKIPTIHQGKSHSGSFYHKNTQGKPTKANGTPNVNKSKIKNNIFSYYVGGAKYGHPAPFGEELVHDHIISWSNEGDTIYDCFMGSGTTAKVAIDLGRNYIGSEISKEYCDIAEQRLGQGVLL